MGKFFGFLLILSLFFLSCRETKQCARFITKHPACFQQDTVWRYDTLRINSSTLDTAFVDSLVHDTVTVENDSLVIKYIRVKEKVYLKGEVKKQTIIQKIPVKIMGPKVRVPYIPWWITALLAGMAIYCGILTLQRFNYR